MPPGGHRVADRIPGHEEARRWLRGLEAEEEDLGASLLIVAAHPDDEVISTGAQLPRFRGVRLLHVTDGAPRNLRDAAAVGFEGWQAYAKARRAELLAALALAGIVPGHADQLGIPDQATSLQMVELAEAFAGEFRKYGTEIVMTHPYEGGHPDHDATAFATHAACELIRQRHRRAPAIVEMTSYHAGPGGRVMFGFLPRPEVEVTTLVLGEAERAFKRQLIDCFSTQKAVLADFPLELERFRPAPAYDFTRPPHAGRLHYEAYDWGMDGVCWRILAREALAALKMSAA
jgi:LmbE family N-acetylglucosaminyl deacetylase